MINSVYGNTLENLQKRISFKIESNEKDFLKHISKTTFVCRKITEKYYVAIHEVKPVLTLNKFIYVRFTVLELSKCLRYDFHYKFIRKTLMLNCYLLTQAVLLMK